MPVPNFLIIGAAKAATTSLSSLLDTHPDAGIARGKEPHFFSYDHAYALGWEKYLALYAHLEDRKAIGDASTSYSRIRYHPQVIGRIRKHLDRPKIIYMVRHPLDRMVSAYVEHMCSAGPMIFASINDAVRRQPMLIDSSRYWEVFDAYRAAVGEEQIEIIWFEEYVADITAGFRKVCRFLEIDDTAAPDLTKQRTNPRNNAPNHMAQLGREEIELRTEWDPVTRRWVINLIKEDNCRFLRHFGKPLDHWGELYGGC